MRNIKIITVAFFIALLCLNSDCNKVEETPVFNGYVLEGRLVNSCTDNTPLKNKTFEFRGENDQIGKEIIKGKTDSNGYFSVLSNLKVKYLIMEDGFGLGKTILYKIPGGQSINFGNVAYNFTMGLRLIYKNYKSILATDSLFINAQGVNPTNPYKSSYVKGPLTSEDLGVIYLKETPMYLNKDSTQGFIYLYKNILNATSPIFKKNYLVSTNCSSIQELIIE